MGPFPPIAPHADWRHNWRVTALADISPGDVIVHVAGNRRTWKRHRVTDAARETGANGRPRVYVRAGALKILGDPTCTVWTEPAR